jgi:hypothetical protein
MEPSARSAPYVVVVKQIVEDRNPGHLYEDGLSIYPAGSLDEANQIALRLSRAKLVEHLDETAEMDDATEEAYEKEIAFNSLFQKDKYALTPSTIFKKWSAQITKANTDLVVAMTPDEVDDKLEACFQAQFRPIDRTWKVVIQSSEFLS